MTDDPVEAPRRANTLEMPMILVPEGQDPNEATTGFSINPVRIPVEIILDAPDEAGARAGFAGPQRGPGRPASEMADSAVRDRRAPDLPLGPDGQRPLAPRRTG